MSFSAYGALRGPVIVSTSSTSMILMIGDSSSSVTVNSDRDGVGLVGGVCGRYGYRVGILRLFVKRRLWCFNCPVPRSMENESASSPPSEYVSTSGLLTFRRARM